MLELVALKATITPMHRISPFPDRATFRAAFTLIELLVVISIIAILAALTLGTVAYVQKKGMRSRAEAEVAALNAAIESYKLDYGEYPSSNSLASELTAKAGVKGVNTNKVYFEPRKGMVTNNQILDPWGVPYNYTTNPTVNVGFFDLWTVAGSSNNSALYIRN